MAPSRGIHISAYIPPLGEGAKIPLSCLSAGFTTGITAGGITSAYIGTGAVVAVKIGAAAVTSAKIGAAAVTSAKIGTNNVHNANISAKSITSAKIRAAFLSGTIVSGKITRAIAHGLGVKPKFVVVAPLHTLAQAISATSLNLSLAAASAATSANFYVVGNQPTNGAMKYVAYVQL